MANKLGAGPPRKPRPSRYVVGDWVRYVDSTNPQQPEEVGRIEHVCGESAFHGTMYLVGFNGGLFPVFDVEISACVRSELAELAERDERMVEAVA